jgi:hypothetical protein
MKYKVYEITPRLGCYQGFALVAANSAEEANHFIDKFIKDDPENKMDSWGYSKVSEHDVIEDAYSESEGIIRHGIFYYG